MTEIVPEIDKDGFILLPKKFTKLGFNFELVKELDGNWKIFKRWKEGINPARAHYELILSKPMPSYVIANVIMPAKWSYPSANMWGIEAYTLNSVEDCIKKYNKIKKKIL